MKRNYYRTGSAESRTPRTERVGPTEPKEILVAVKADADIEGMATCLRQRGINVLEVAHYISAVVVASDTVGSLEELAIIEGVDRIIPAEVFGYRK